MAKNSRFLVEPARQTRPEWPDAARAAAIIDRFRTVDGAMLPLLHALQDEFGYVPSEAEPMIAVALNLSRAEVFGVISFYHDFRRQPAGKHVLKLCRAEACQATGAVTLANNLLARLGIEWGGRTADGDLTVDPSFCLGLCACGPAALLDGAPLARLTSATLDHALSEVLA